jgi:hypothetical protein
MTRSEIREAIKKVFFEEIEPDSFTTNNKTKQEHLNQTYKTLDGKYTLKSRHETLAYNIFDKEGILDQIKPQGQQFQKTCHKVPDFVWESKKIIIEIAGVNESLRPGYWEKLLTAKPCFEKQGYTVYIIDTRKGSPYYNYIKFYNYLCKLLGFIPKSEIKDNILSYIGDPIDLVKRNQEIIQYKNNNRKASYSNIANKFNTTAAIVRNILKQANISTSYFQDQNLNQEIIQYKKDNRNATAKEIADKFSTPDKPITDKIIYKILDKARLTTPLSQNLTRNQEIIQYKNNNRKASHQEIADKFSTPDKPITYNMVSKILRKADLTTPQNLARNQEIIQYNKDNPTVSYQEIANKFSTPDKPINYNTVYNILNPRKKSNPTNEQSLNHKIMTRRELREIIKKAMQESTIDVPGDPNKLTPQQKSAEISKARQKTRKPKLGTSEDPVDFI